MIDPVMGGFDMPSLIEMPITEKQIPHLNGILLILWHWGSADAPEWKEFNGNPEELCRRVKNPEGVD